MEIKGMKHLETLRQIARNQRRRAEAAEIRAAEVEAKLSHLCECVCRRDTSEPVGVFLRGLAFDYNPKSGETHETSQGSTLPPKTVIFTHTAVLEQAPDMPLEPHGFEGLDEIAEPVSYTVNKGFRRTKIGEETLFDADPDCEHDIQAKPNGGVGCVKCGGWFCF